MFRMETKITQRFHRNGYDERGVGLGWGLFRLYPSIGRLSSRCKNHWER